jgi:hypothetical protein
MNVTEQSLFKDKALLFIVDIENMLKEKTILKKTNSYDSIETKREQVGNNIIDNAWVLYNKIINNRINDEIEKRIPSINYIECNEYNENELVNVQFTIKRKTILDLREHYFDQINNLDLINSEIDVILRDFVKEVIDKQQSTTVFLKFNGRKPNKLVLKKLEIIGIILTSEQGVLIQKSKLRQIIEDTFNPDPRTIENYMQCLMDFGVQNGKQVNESYFEILFNMRGFLETVRRYLNENII